MKRGPAPKDPEHRQRRNKGPGPGKDVQLRPRLQLSEVPKPPAGLLKATVREWNDYWTSDLACLVDQVTALPAIRRLFTMKDERERCYQLYRLERLVTGSQGQLVPNPAFKMAAELDREIRALEDRYGMNVQSMLKLGLQFGRVKKSVEDMNAELNRDHGQSDEAGEAQDPRVISIAR